MGIATGITADEMMRIKNLSIASGLVDVNGHLILKNVGGTSSDAGLVKGAQGIQGIQGLKGDKGDQGIQGIQGNPGIQGVKGDKGDQGIQGIQGIQGVKGDNALYGITGSGGTRTYVRLASINGNGGSGGAYATMILSGLGDYGDPDKATVLVHFSQRGDNSVTVKAWGWNIQALSSNYLTLYTKQISTWTFELWGLFANYTFNMGLTALSQSHGQTGQSMIYNDSRTTTAPTGLSAAYTIDPAVPDEIDTGWVNLTVLSGFTAGTTPSIPKYRVKAGVLYCKGGVNGTFTSGTYTNVVSGIPSQYVPPAGGGSGSVVARGGAAGAGGRADLWQLNTDGTIAVAWSNLGQTANTGPGWMEWTFSMPID